MTEDNVSDLCAGPCSSAVSSVWPPMRHELFQGLPAEVDCDFSPTLPG